MVFPISGENHYNGIKNEKKIVKYLNENPENPIIKQLEKDNNSKVNSFNHKGGTRQKRDASYNLENGKTKGISIKNHKKDGTFDWINTTVKKSGLDCSNKLHDQILEFKEKNKNKPIPKKGGIRSELDEIFSQHLDKLKPDEITEILSNIYKTEDDTDVIIINNLLNKEFVLVSESNLDPYCNPNHGHNFILKSTSRAKTSRQIWIKSKDGNEINTNLRIRLSLNNGITALLGKSKKNKSSIPTIKIQQDKVNEFIKKCFGKIICKY